MEAKGLDTLDPYNITVTRDENPFPTPSSTAHDRELRGYTTLRNCSDGYGFDVPAAA